MIKRATLKDVAARAGVSYQTVSKIINGKAQVSAETEKRVWKAIHELGYRPSLLARGLRDRRSRMIGYSWAPTPPDQANPILDQFLQSMVTSAEEAGYHILCFPHRIGVERIDTYRELIDTHRVDCFVVSGVEYDDARISYLQEREIPFVAFGRSNPGWIFPYVDVDGAAGIRMVTEHLIERGHQRIGILAWPENSRVGQNRLEGYFEAMSAAGIPQLPDWIVRGEGRFSYGQSGANRLLALPSNQRPTAIITLNDPMAIGAMHAVLERGLRVGDDIAVTGFDDTPTAKYLHPSLTSIRQPIWEIGKRIIAMLMGILEGNPVENQQELFEPELIIRQSSSGLITMEEDRP